MPVNFSVKHVPDAVAESLRARAKRNHRSLQGELLAVLETAAQSIAGNVASPAPAEVRQTASAWSEEPVSAAAMPPAPSPSEARAPAPPFSLDRHKLGDFCRRHRIRRLSLFGSALRPDFRPDSDVDFLVEFDEGHTRGFGIFRVEEELSALVGGRKVDLVDRRYLNARLKPIILASARVLYAEG